MKKVCADTPIVEIKFSESKSLKAGSVYPLRYADDLFAGLDFSTALDLNMKGCGGYDKTEFLITGTHKGEPLEYKGRYDLGDNEGGLMEHIKGRYEMARKTEPDKAETLKDLIEYFEKHIYLSALEEKTKIHLMMPQKLTRSELSYHMKVRDYIAVARKMLNEGEYNLPELPQAV